MSDEPTTPPATDPPAEPDAEESFWKKFDARLESILDKRETVKKADPPKPDKPPTGTSRTGGKRVTLQSLWADLVFGPPKDE